MTIIVVFLAGVFLFAGGIQGMMSEESWGFPMALIGFFTCLWCWALLGWPTGKS